MDAFSQQYCLRWNNHQSNLMTVFEELLENEAFADVTLAVDGGASVKCHKMVLAACSSYFQTLFIDLPCKHPIVVLKDVKYSEIKAIVEYMYRGEVNIEQKELSGLLKIAEVLKVKGLVESNGLKSKCDGDRKSEASSSPPPAISTSTPSAAHSSDQQASPPHSTGGHQHYPNYYGKSAIDKAQNQGQGRMPSVPVCAFPGLTPPQASPAEPTQNSSLSQHSSNFTPGLTYNEYEVSPGKRKFSSFLVNRDTPILRTVLGQSHVDSSQQTPTFLHPDCHDLRASSNGSAADEKRNSQQYNNESAHSSYTDASILDQEDDKLQASPQSFSSEAKVSIGYGATNQREKPEWKRYKQYTREDMMSAIEAVKSGMSALQAARKYGVPPRTLYDKVKKMGITTSRPFKRGSNGSSASFPYGIGGNINGSIYGGSSFYESDNESTTHVENSAMKLEPTNYKWRDVSVERETIDIQRCDPNITVHSIIKHPCSNDDQVEDLSMNRKSDLRVIVPPPNVSIKEEDQSTSSNIN